MSFLKKLFGGGDDSGGAQKVLGQEEYNGFVIKALDMRAGSEYQLCGSIEKEIDGALKVHNFIRADRIASADQVAQTALSKGRQIIDEQGERVFS